MKKIKAWFKKLFVVNEKISIKILWTWICISLSLSILFYCLTNFKILNMETSLTAFIALTGALPTVYLWIVRERKKEKDQEIALKNLEKKEKNQEIALSSLKKKDIELYQNKIAELNKVYVDAITQFYNSQSFMAGAYALNALVDDWLALASEHSNDSVEHFIRVSQISSILFSEDLEKINNSLFNHLIEQLFIKIAILTSSIENFEFSWDGFKFYNLEFPLKYLNDADLRNVNLTKSNLSGAHLKRAYFGGAYLVKTNLSFTHLENAHLNGAILIATNFFGATTTKVDVNNAIFGGTIISKDFIFSVTGLTLKQLKNCLIASKETEDAQPIIQSTIQQIEFEVLSDDDVISKEILKKYFT